MDQIESVINIELLFYIQQERQDNEMVEKIIFNNSREDQWDQLFKSKQKAQVIGLYGTLESIQQYLSTKTCCKINIGADVLKWQNRGILCWSNYQEIYYISFIGLESYYMMPIFQESPEITVYRFLRDLCHTILLLPSQSILQNWKNSQTHFYQEQESIVEDFEIIKLEESEIILKEIDLKFENISKLDILPFTPGQGNIRMEYFNRNEQDKQFGNLEQEIQKVFLKLLQIKNFDIYLINFDCQNVFVQNIIRQSSKDCKEKLQNYFTIYHQKTQKSIQSETLNKLGMGNILKKNSKKFELLHNLMFEIFREKMNFESLDIPDTKKIKERIIVKDLDYQKEIQNNEQQLQEIINDYIKSFQNIYVQKDFSIKQIFTDYQNDIIKQIKEQQSTQKDIIIDLKLYEFKYITQKDTNSEAQTIIEQIKTLKVSLTDIIISMQNKPIEIIYFCLSANNKHNYLILPVEFKEHREYIWIDAQSSKSQAIMRINQVKSMDLQFHYEQSNTTLFIFNTKLGISMIMYSEDRNLILREKSISTKEVFSDFCYLRYSECFILINKANGLFKWDINQSSIQNLNLEAKFCDRQNQSLKYSKVMSAGSGNYYILANSEKCDIYNFNNENVAQFSFINYGIKTLNVKQIYLFSNEQDWFICMVDKHQPVSIQIKNMSSQQKIIYKNEIEQTTKFTNPYLDLVRGSVVKYGPTINLYNFEPIQTQLYAQEETYQIIVNYFKLIDFTLSDKLNSCQNINDIGGPLIEVSQLTFNIINRASIQLCTIEKQLLIPLCDGLRLKQPSENNVVRVLDKVEQIKFGFLERLLSYDKSKLYIISIMGRQSSGKSYLLNRVFATRFGVSSARCTDGIWLSISKIDDIVFVLFDCEGLFSARRTPEDETMLLAFLSSISDCTILNQDLTFSRNLNELFLNLSKSIEKIRGEKLFKGKLMIVVRDVNQRERDGAERELLKNIETLKSNQQTGGFLTYLFNNKFSHMLMSYFDTKQFDSDITKLRKKFIADAMNTKRWEDQNQLLRAMKIMLVQLELKDHRSLEDHELDHTILILQRKANELWQTLKQNSIEEIKFIDIQETYNILINLLQKQIKLDNSTITNNQNLKNMDDYIQKLLKQRQIQVLNVIDLDINGYTTLSNKEKLQRIQIEIMQFLQDQSNQYQICLDQCSECFLLCKQRKNHVQREQVQQMNNLKEYLNQLKIEIDEKNKKITIKEDLDFCYQQLASLKKECKLFENQIQFKILEQQIQSGENKINIFFSNDKFNLENFSEQLIMYFKAQMKDSIVDNNLVMEFNDNLQTSNQCIINISSIIEKFQEIRQQWTIKLEILINDDLYNEKQQLVSQIDRIQFELSCTFKQKQQLQQNQDKIIIQIRQDEQIEVVKRYLQGQLIQLNELEQCLEKRQQFYKQIQQIKDSYGQSKDFIRKEMNQPEGINNYIEKQISQSENDRINLEGDQQKLKLKLQNLQKQIEANKKKVQNQANQNLIKKNDEDVQTLVKQISDQQEKILLVKQQLDKWQNLQEEYQNLVQPDKEDIKQHDEEDIQQPDKEDIEIKQNEQIDLYVGKDIDEQSSQIIDQFIEKVIIIQYPDHQNQNQQLQQQIDQLEIAIQDLKLLETYKNNLQQQILEQSEIQNFTCLLEKQNIDLDLLKDQLGQCNQKLIDKQKEIEIISKNIEDLDANILQEQQKIQDQTHKQERIQKYMEQYNYITKIYENLMNLQNERQNIFDSDQNILTVQLLSELQSNLALKSNEIILLTEQYQLKQQIHEQEQQYKSKSEEFSNFEQFIKKQHQCGRDNHSCDQICDGCKNPAVFCKENAGHQESKDGNPYHLCINPKHYCIQKCSIVNCEKQCQNQYNHEDTLQHDCLQKHKCLQICKFCSNICDININEPHETHICSVKNCTKECHFSITAFREKQCLNTCAYSHSEPHDIHICNSQYHSCTYQCGDQGVCEITSYVEQIKTWKTKDGISFEYKVHQQNPWRLQCQLKFEINSTEHSCKSNHTCLKNHTCFERCPECRAFCTEPFGHSGKHKPHLHRNKEQQIFTAVEGSYMQKLVIKEEGESEREFSLGESCEPETCTRSCTRRSRAHFHLVECKGGKDCLEKIINKEGKIYARHQQKKYQGSDKYHDEVLCEQFWDHLRWENPIEAKQIIEISLCDYYCTTCGEKDKRYCTQEAWHTFSSKYSDHTFSCKESHKKINGVDVQFVIDTTGSMKQYIEMVNQTVSRLMLSTNQYFKDNPSGIKFSVVSYKDHSDPKVVESINFTTHDKAVNFINNLKADGGDDYPEAIMDGLNDGAEQSWRSDSKKFLFLIADSPPHGVPKFHNKKDNYPNGCPCKLNEESVLSKIQSIGIELIVLKLNDNLNQTIKVFKDIMPSLMYLDKMSNFDFILKIESLVCKQLQIREITLSKG